MTTRSVGLNGTGSLFICVDRLQAQLRLFRRPFVDAIGSPALQDGCVLSARLGDVATLFRVVLWLN